MTRTNNLDKCATVVETTNPLSKIGAFPTALSILSIHVHSLSEENQDMPDASGSTRQYLALALSIGYAPYWICWDKHFLTQKPNLKNDSNPLSSASLMARLKLSPIHDYPE